LAANQEWIDRSETGGFPGGALVATNGACSDGALVAQERVRGRGAMATERWKMLADRRDVPEVLAMGTPCCVVRSIAV